MTSCHRPAGGSLAGRSPVHGFSDDEATRRLLRSRPPGQALAWVAARLGGPVISPAPCTAGCPRRCTCSPCAATEGSAARPCCAATSARNSTRTNQISPCVRHGRFASPSPWTCRPHRCWRPTPREARPGYRPFSCPGCPAGSTGGQRIWTAGCRAWPGCCRTSTPARSRPRECCHSFAPYPQASYRPPSWARYPAVWERAAEISQGPVPVLPAVLLHRDFHPGNVLWRRGAVCGVVNWVGACTGPAVADVAHCRVNLLTVGADAAGRFTAMWQSAAGAAVPPVGRRRHHHRLPRRPARRLGIRTVAGRGHARPRCRRTRREQPVTR